MNESCCIMERNQNNNKQQKNNLNGQSQRAISLYQIDQGLRRAENYRLKQYFNQSERLRRQVQKVRNTAETRKEEMRQAQLKKQEWLNKTLSEAQLRRNQYLETARQNAREHFNKVRTIANANYVSKRVLLWRQSAQSNSQLWNAEWRRSRALALKVRNACLSPNAKYDYSSQYENLKGDGNHYSIQERHDAAALIQFFWRIRFIERIFSKLHLSWECCAKEGFDETKNKILDQQAQKAAESVVHLFYPSSRAMLASELKPLSRLFLTSFVIAAHPQHVLEHPDSGLEKSVVDAARRLLGYLMDPHLNAVTSAIKARRIWTKYRVLYEEWERSDRERLIDGIMKDYVELETMKLKVNNSVSTKQAFNRQRRLSPNIAPWKGKESQTIGAIWLPQIRKRQSRLRAALFRVGGHKALDSLERNIQDIQKSFESLPAVDEPTHFYESHLSQVSKDEYAYAQSGMNEIFAHEIMINVEEFIKELETPEEYNTLLTIARKAYREKLEQAFCSSDESEESANEQFLKLIEEIRDKLIATLPQNSCATTDNCKAMLQSHLDMEILRNQIGHNAFTVHDAIQLLRMFTETLQSIEAAERDEELQLWEESWFSEFVNFDYSQPMQKRKLLSLVANRLCDILDRLDIIERDIVVSKIRILEPVLKCYGPQWEDNRFQEKIFKGIFKKELPQTRLWLTNSMKKLKQVYTTFDCMQLVVQGEGDSMKRFLEASFVYLMDEREEEGFIVPEVLKLDERRLHRLRENLCKYIYIASLGLIVRRFVMQKDVEWNSMIEQCWSDVVVDWKESKWAILEAGLDKQLLSFMEKVFACDSTANFSQQDKNFLSSLWRRVLSGNEPISSLLRRRVIDFFYRHFLFHVSLKCPPRKQLQSLGLGYVVDDILDILETVKSITRSMLAVHFHRLKHHVLRIAELVDSQSCL
ncbi:hypothetical protein GpartN1_g7655.t1 [Galdieria partita]|uniref:Uncharacterized protein n=1 Tax=Galdieria partita TaxID=83374 RepID=A0A9C7UTY4_9RHOD|nr:hypothetical protein GpartN1_g7655.t1 [Galdieria partita]